MSRDFGRPPAPRGFQQPLQTYNDASLQQERPPQAYGDYGNGYADPALQDHQRQQQPFDDQYYDDQQQQQYYDDQQQYQQQQQPAYPHQQSPLQTPNMRAQYHGMQEQPYASSPLQQQDQRQPPAPQPPPPQQQQQQQPPKQRQRIDPKQVPRAQVESVGTEAVVYYTRSKDLPPPCTSTFTVVDEGNASPRFVRMTTNCVPTEEELVDTTKLMVGCMLQPLAELGADEDAIPVVDTQGQGPIRCARCRGYACPFFKFTEDGRKFICSLCRHTNPVPDYYYSNLDPNGQRRDRLDRPELCRGSVEFVATPEYCIRPTSAPHYLFVVDVSNAAMTAGLLGCVLSGIRHSLDDMANYCPNARVGIITFHRHIHFYSIKATRQEPELFVVADVDDVFLPCTPEDLFADVSGNEEESKSRFLFDELVQMLPDIHDPAARGPTDGCAFGAAVTAASKALAKTGGKVLVFTSGITDVGAGELKARDDANLYGTDQEETLLVPQTSFYEELGVDCAEHGVAVDIFVCANNYVDLSTTAPLSNTTGGQVNVYKAFNANKDSIALQADMYHNLTRETGSDAVLLVRCSDGLKVADCHGNFFRKRALEMELATIDSDKAFGITFAHDGKLEDKSEACIQAALLYTTRGGERRIRVHTLALPTTSVMGNLFRNADLDTIVALSLKQAAKQIFSTAQPRDVRAALMHACVQSLFAYRKYCASSTSPGQLILPETLKLLPLNTLGMLKNVFFHSGQHADARAEFFSLIASMPVYVAVPFVVPRLFELTNIPEGTCVPDETGRVYLPPVLTLSSDSIASDGIYLLDDGMTFFVWIGDTADRQLVADIFVRGGGGKGGDDKKSGRFAVSDEHLDDPYHIATKVFTLVDQLRRTKSHYAELSVVARAHGQVGETLDERFFFKNLLEDAMSGTSVKPSKGSEKDPSQMSYLDALVYLHGQIQQLSYN